MAEAIAVVGVIASFIQLTEFGFKVAHRLKDFTSQTKDVPESLRHVATELPALLVALKRSAQALAVDNITEEARKALEAPIKECAAEIECLLKILFKIQPKPGQTTKKRIWKGIWSLRYDAKIKNKMAVIRGYAQTLSYYHVTFLSPENSMPANNLPKPLPSSTVPYHRNPDFVDTGILREIEQKLAKPASRVGLFGLGGMGKTQLAIEYAHIVRERSPKTWVFWINADTLIRFEEGCRKIAEETKPLGWDDPKSNTMELAKTWLCDERNGPWLIILDNADDPTIFSPDETYNSSAARGISSPGHHRLLDMIPQSPNGSVLVTSRRHRNDASKFNLRNCEILEVGQMDQECGMLLLARKLNSRVQLGGEDTKLVEALQCLPLAITHAAAFIHQAHMSISEYMTLYHATEEKLERRSAESPITSIQTTWELSFRAIQQESPSAAPLLSLMSLFDGKEIPEFLLKGPYQASLEGSRNSGAASPAADVGYEDKFDKAISVLMAYSLVTMNTRDEFEMHPLVHAWTKKSLELDNNFERWKGKYIDTMRQAFPNDNKTTAQALLPHVEAMLAYQPSNDDQSLSWADVVFRAGEFHRKSERYREAEGLHRMAFVARRKELGEENPVTLQSLDRLRHCKEVEPPGSQALELVQTLKIQTKYLKKKLFFLQSTLLFVVFFGLVLLKRLLVI